MKQYYAGYNRYGINVVGYTSIRVFPTARKRDEWVKMCNRQHEKDVAEAITAKIAYQEMPCLRTGMYDIEETVVIYNPNKRFKLF